VAHYEATLLVKAGVLLVTKSGWRVTPVDEIFDQSEMVEQREKQISLSAHGLIGKVAAERGVTHTDNPKVILQQLMEKCKSYPEFDTKRYGADHCPVFCCEIFHKGVFLGIGWSKRRSFAETLASSDVLVRSGLAAPPGFAEGHGKMPKGEREICLTGTGVVVGEDERAVSIEAQKPFEREKPSVDVLPSHLEVQSAVPNASSHDQPPMGFAMDSATAARIIPSEMLNMDVGAMTLFDACEVQGSYDTDGVDPASIMHLPDGKTWRTSWDRFPESEIDGVLQCEIAHYAQQGRAEEALFVKIETEFCNMFNGEDERAPRRYLLVSLRECYFPMITGTLLRIMRLVNENNDINGSYLLKSLTLIDNEMAEIRWDMSSCDRVKSANNMYPKMLIEVYLTDHDEFFFETCSNMYNTRLTLICDDMKGGPMSIGMLPWYPSMHPDMRYTSGRITIILFLPDIERGFVQSDFDPPHTTLELQRTVMLDADNFARRLAARNGIQSLSGLQLKTTFQGGDGKEFLIFTARFWTYEALSCVQFVQPPGGPSLLWEIVRKACDLDVITGLPRDETMGAV
jgi:hypothetical protein